VAPEEFLDAIDGSPMGPGYAQVKGSPMVAGEYDETAFPLELASKDAGLVVEAARAAGAELPALEAARREFERAVELGRGREDMAAVHAARSERSVR
jgi:3-hydroxyisobutyrate dehydrogenase